MPVSVTRRVSFFVFAIFAQPVNPANIVRMKALQKCSFNRFSISERCLICHNTSAAQRYTFRANELTVFLVVIPAGNLWLLLPCLFYTMSEPASGPIDLLPNTRMNGYIVILSGETHAFRRVP